MTYEIHEANLERLEKHMTRIGNKAAKYGNPFTFKVTGEVIREVEQPIEGSYKTIKVNARFVIVEVEGTAIINDWMFIASLEHTENGNIIKCAVKTEVPERYYYAEPTCEHCTTKRARTHSYIIQNTVTGEFKQVGKSCLKDFTNGMSAEQVAQIISWYDSVMKFEAIEAGYHVEHYLKSELALRIVTETIRRFGYVKKYDEDGTPNGRSTVSRASDYYYYFQGYLFPEHRKVVRQEIEQSGFNHESDETIQDVKNALEWLKTKDDANNYFHNLKVACLGEYISQRNFALVASMIPTYYREFKRLQEMTVEKKVSAHVGEVGQRIEVEIKDFRCLTSWESQFGVTYLWKITDTNGNVFTWKSGNIIEDDAKRIKGTVKEHAEFAGVQQTELTRCKVVTRPPLGIDEGGNKNVSRNNRKKDPHYNHTC